MRLERLVGRGLVLAPIVFLAIFFVYPLASILIVSLAPQGQIDLTGFVTLVTSNYYRQTLWFTFWQAAVSTLLTLALALPGAYVFARFSFPGKSVLLALATLPFLLPTVVVAAAFSALVGPRGVLNQWLMDSLQLTSPPVELERTLAIILIVHVFYNYAVALRIISTYWLNVNPRLEESARVLGAYGWWLWWDVRLPLLHPAILAAAALVFVFTFTSFGVVLILGGPRFATLEVEIYRQTAHLFNLPMAAALSLVQMAVMFAMMSLYTRLQRRLALERVSAEQTLRRPRTPLQYGIITLNLALMAVLLFAPLAALVGRSFSAGGQFTLTYYQMLATNPRGSVLFVPPLQAVTNSLVFAALTTGLAISLGAIAAHWLARRASRWTAWLDSLFMLPLATSAVTLGFGYIIALDRPPLNLRTSPALIVAAHTLVALPFVMRSVLPALRSITPSIQESARVLGASSWQVWRLIDLPLISRSLVTGAIFGFTVSLGEFGASLFVARPNTPTMPIVIYRLLGQPGPANYGQALAMSTLLLAAACVAFLLIERLRRANGSEF